MRLYNTATRRKETFRPLEDGRVGMYVCGVTVYDLCHIGHARSAVVFDVLARYLRAKGLDVKYVRNFTDVDDKIIQRARELAQDPSIIAEEYIQAFHDDMRKLGVARAGVEPRATEHIDQMISMIRILLKKGYAYEADKDVFFSVEKFKGYGSLSGRRLEDMQAGSRVEVDARKHHPMDFVLWKAAKPGEPCWKSPWGLGRPGWHLECSVMSNHYLGATFDIHGGGKDLLFPHHENERAQSVGANGGEFARYWVHNGFVTVNSEKMSKSLGNFLTIRDALRSYDPEVLRFFLLSKHYRSPLDFSDESVGAARAGLIRIYRALERFERALGNDGGDANRFSRPVFLPGAGKDSQAVFLGDFVEVMDDDLNTAGAIGLLFDHIRDTNRWLDTQPEPLSVGARSRLDASLRAVFAAGGVLGLFARGPAAFFREMAHREEAVDIENLIRERAEARTRKAWARADEIRDFLREKGITLEDGPQGTRWRFDV